MKKLLKVAFVLFVVFCGIKAIVQNSAHATETAHFETSSVMVVK